jgi:hypothetical protein
MPAEPTFASFSWTTWAPWAAIALLVAIGLAVALLRRRGRAAVPDPWRLAGPRAGGAAGGDPRADLELERLAGVMERRLDERIDRLEALIPEADRALRALELYVDALSGIAERLPAADGSRGDGEPVKARAAPDGDGRDVPDPAGRDVHGAAAARERVLALARAGKRPESISEALGLRRGEVDLILGLERIAQRAKEALRDGPRGS